MEAIEFVVRDRAGNIRRSMLSGSDAADTIFLSSGDDISLNLRRFQVVGYERAGDAMIVTLADGRKIRLEGYFSADASLYLSADGVLAEVDFATANEGTVDAVYADAEVFGKWSPDDALFHVGGPEIDTVIAAAGEEETATMLAAPILAGLGGIGAGGAGAAAALVGGAALIDGGGGGGSPLVPDTQAPDISLDTGVVSVDHVFDAEDHADGVEIGGAGEPGASIVVEIDGETQETTVSDDGTWGVVFDPVQIPEGEYDVDVTVTAIDDAGNETVLTDVVRIDTVTAVDVLTIDGAATGSGDVITATEHADGVSMTGTGEVGATVVVTLEGGASADVVVDADGNWAVNFTSDQVGTGEYSQGVTVTSTDIYGNMASTSATMVVDTFTDVEITGNNSGVDGTYNQAEASSPAVLNGTAQAGASVVVTLTGPNGQTLGTQTVTANDAGAWTVQYPAGSLPAGECEVTVMAIATDTAGNSETTSATIPVDTMTNVNLTQIDGSPTGSGTINAQGHADGVTMSGTGEAGGTVTVSIAGGGSANAVVATDGTWQVNFVPSLVPTGERTADVTVSIEDAHGNTETSQATMAIDTLTNVVITGNNTGTDNVMNLVESKTGAMLTGTAQAGATVEVTLTTTAGAVLGNQTVIANSAGNWTANYATATLPGGEYDVNVSAVATDQAGNTAMTSSTFAVDTIANVTVDTDNVESNGIINIAEAADGVLITGTAEAGSQVSVNFGGSPTIVIANGSGNWTANFGPGDVPAGIEKTIPVTATFTDLAGNTATDSGTVEVDTIVRNLSVNPVTGDGVVDASEAGSGFTLTGTTEAGALSVMVTFHNMPPREAQVSGNGTWSVTFGPHEIPTGEYTSQVTVETVDRNGNPDSVTAPVTVDTEVPDAPLVISYTEYTRGDPGISGVGTEVSDDIVAISQVSSGGQVGNVAYSANTIAEVPGVRDGELQFTFNERIPDGSNLVINSEDNVGNESATFVVLDDNAPGAVNVTTAGLSQFNVGAIDLSIVEESVLNLTESDLIGLSDDTNSLIIHGDVSDVINVNGAQRTGQTEMIDNKLYDIYTLGEEGSLIIEQAVTVNY